MRAIIFDFNGVIADDETPHLHCFQQALAEQGIELSREDYYGTYLGMNERTCTAALLQAKAGVCDTLLHSGIIERKAMLFRAYTALHKPVLSPG
ncbi:MAG: HAD hydrolase-like protein [Nitrospira sp.]